MIVGVQDIYFYVQNMQRALRFYRDILGLRVTEEDEHWSALDVGAVRVGLHGTGGTPVPPVPRDTHGARAGGTLTLRVSDIRAAVARLQATGVRFLGEIVDAPWGSSVAFEDPDGNVLMFMQPGNS